MTVEDEASKHHPVPILAICHRLYRNYYSLREDRGIFKANSNNECRSIQTTVVSSNYINAYIVM